MHAWRPFQSGEALPEEHACPANLSVDACWAELPRGSPMESPWSKACQRQPGLGSGSAPDQAVASTLAMAGAAGAGHLIVAVLGFAQAKSSASSYASAYVLWSGSLSIGILVLPLNTHFTCAQRPVQSVKLPARAAASHSSVTREAHSCYP